MKGKHVVRGIVTAVLVSGLVLGESAWRQASVPLEWTQQPNPDETGDSLAQKAPLLGTDSLAYKRRQNLESYTLSVVGKTGITLATVVVPKGTTVAFDAMHCDSDVCDRYSVDRSDGLAAKVSFETNRPPSIVPENAVQR